VQPASFPGSLQNRLLKGLGANLLGQIINLASRVLLVPLFLLAWGAEVYGEWLVLSSLAAYLALTDLGGQNYIVNRLTQAYARQDLPLFKKVLHSGLALYLVLPGLVFALFTGAILWCPAAGLLKIKAASPRTVTWVLVIMAGQFLFSLPQGLLLGVYRAVGLLPRGVMLANLMQLLALALMATGLWLRGGMVAVACLQVLPFLLAALVALGDLDRLFPHFQLLSFKEANFPTARSFIKPSLAFFGIQVSQAFSLQGTVLLVGMLLGALPVVIFTTLRTIVSTMRQFLDQLFHTAWPELTRLDAQQQADKFHVLFRGLLRTGLLGTLIFMAIFHFFGAEIYHFWLRGTVPFNQNLLDLFLILMAQMTFWLACRHPLLAINRHQQVAQMTVASSLVSLALAYGGGRFWGLPGVVLGMIAGDLLLPFWYMPYLLNRYQAQFSLGFFTRELGAFVAGLALVVLAPWLAPLVFLLALLWWLCCLPGKEVGGEGALTIVSALDFLKEPLVKWRIKKDDF
jgi:O-antigen/teichoic acid export membrane protein